MPLRISWTSYRNTLSETHLAVAKQSSLAVSANTNWQAYCFDGSSSGKALLADDDVVVSEADVWNDGTAQLLSDSLARITHQSQHNTQQRSRITHIKLRPPALAPRTRLLLGARTQPILRSVLGCTRHCSEAAVVASHCHRARYTKTSRHPLNPLYVYCNAARGGPSHGHR